MINQIRKTCNSKNADPRLLQILPTIFETSNICVTLIEITFLIHRATGVTGVVRVNEKQTSTTTESYRKLSCYIHQEDLVRPMLSVGETMMITAHLKLGFRVTQEYKLNIVKKVLVLLGLDHRYNTYTVKLSGGQKKRLAIALELICNPPVLYLDEPTR